MNQGNGGLSSGGKAAVSIFVLAIVIGTVVAVLVVIFVLWRRKKRPPGLGHEALGRILL